MPRVPSTRSRRCAPAGGARTVRCLAGRGQGVVSEQSSEHDFVATSRRRPCPRRPPHPWDRLLDLDIIAGPVGTVVRGHAVQRGARRARESPPCGGRGSKRPRRTWRGRRGRGRTAPLSLSTPKAWRGDRRPRTAPPPTASTSSTLAPLSPARWRCGRSSSTQGQHRRGDGLRSTVTFRKPGGN